MIESGMPNMQYQMPVMPAPWGGYYPNQGNSDMFGGGNFLWFLLIWMAMFGWGGNGGAWGNNGGCNAGAEVQRGFDQQSIMTGISGLREGQSAGFAGVNQALSSGFYQAEIAANNRQMNDMQRDFTLQQGMNQCCCDQRAGLADLKYTVADEGCKDRNALQMGIRDINDNNNRNHQAVMDKLCQLEMDGFRRQIAERDDTISQLRTQILLKDNRASDAATTAEIMAGQRALANEVEQYLAPTPRPAYMVPNPNCCPNQGWGYGYGRQCA